MSTSDETSADDLGPFVAWEVYPDASAIFAVHPSPVIEVKDEAVVVLDTNVLLAPYTVGPRGLAEIGRIYEYIAGANRLVVPAQVAREFAKHRANKLADLFQQLTRKRNESRAFFTGRFPLLESLTEYQTVVELEQELDRKIHPYREALGAVIQLIRSWNWDDPVSLLYSRLFKSEVVIEPQIDDAEFKEDLKRRNTNKIPPGYKDAAKVDNAMGDLLIWHTILEIGRARKANVMFVSGDEKADWWLRSEKQALYPRFELVEEFHRASDGHSFHILRFSEFLDLFDVDQQVVQEVREEEAATRSALDDARVDVQRAVTPTASIYKEALAGVFDGTGVVVTDVSSSLSGIYIVIATPNRRLGVAQTGFPIRGATNARALAHWAYHFAVPAVLATVAAVDPEMLDEVTPLAEKMRTYREIPPPVWPPPFGQPVNPLR